MFEDLGFESLHYQLILFQYYIRLNGLHFSGMKITAFTYSEFSQNVMLMFFQHNLMSEAMSRRIRGLFNAVNFWQIVLYNVLALNSLDFAQLVAKRLLLKGECFALDHYIMKMESS